MFLFLNVGTSTTTKLPAVQAPDSPVITFFAYALAIAVLSGLAYLFIRYASQNEDKEKRKLPRLK